MNFINIQKPLKPSLDWTKIKLMVFDCDGVLTDGRIIYDSAGNESKNFDAHDGMGFNILKHTDIKTAVITGRNSPLLERRCQDLKIDFLFQGVLKKLDKINQLLQELRLDFDNLLMMGDDFNDLPLMLRSAISVCPADTCEDVKAFCDIITQHNGGRGAVRECIELLLTNQGIYEQALLSYLNSIS